MFMKVIFNRAVIALCRLIPPRLAAHLLFLLRMNPKITDRWGYHIRPIHYYEPLPDFASITPSATQCRRLSTAIEFGLPAQIDLTQRLGSRYGAELQVLARPLGSPGFDFKNEYFSHLDAAFYYSLLRELKPQRVIEIGCGYSTRLADQALQLNRAEGHQVILTCIEPYPEARLTDAKLNIELIQRPLEKVSLDFFRQLRSGDVLFVDSSHAVKFQSDVCRAFLEIFPLLPVGVWIHIHDVFLPFDYPIDWLTEKRLAFNEQYILEAFLAFNTYFSPQCALQWLWRDYEQTIRQYWPAEVLPTSDGLGAASFWMKRSN